MERDRKRKSVDKQKQKRNFFVFQNFQVKWMAALTVFSFLSVTALADQRLGFFHDAHGNIAGIEDPLNHNYNYQADSHESLVRFAGSAVDQTVISRNSEINWEKAKRRGKWGEVFGDTNAGVAGHSTGFARAMADLQPYPDGTGTEIRIADGSATSPEDLVKAFSDEPATSQSGERETTPTIGRDPEREDVSDLDKQAREKEARIQEEEVRKTQLKKKEEEDYDRKWTGIIQRMVDLRRQQDEINLEKLKGKQKESEQLLDAARQRTGGMLSDSDFQDRLDQMQSDFNAAKKPLDEDIARSRRSSGSIECARDFTYGGHFNFNCNCDNYVFDFSKGRCVPNKTPVGTGPIVRRFPDKSGLSDVVVNITPTILTVWDHDTEDLDRVNIFLNRQPVRINLTLRNARQNITLYLRPGNNTLEVEALNIGDPVIQKQRNIAPGNAAAVEVQGVVSGKRRQHWSLLTGQVGSLQIYYQP